MMPLSPLRPAPRFQSIQTQRPANKAEFNHTPWSPYAASPRFSGKLPLKLISQLLMALGIVGVPGSTYLGLTHMKAALKAPIKEHSKKAVETTGRLVNEDIADLKDDMKELHLVHMDAVMADAKRLAKDQALAYKKQLIEKFTSIKGLSSLWGKDKNAKDLEKTLDKLSVEDLEQLEKTLKDDKQPLETVQRFKSDLDALTKKRLANSHIKPENYEPVFDAAYEDISTVLVRSGTATASGVAASMTMFILGMVLYLREKKQQSAPAQAPSSAP